MNRNCHASLVEMQNWCYEMTTALAANNSDFFLKFGFGSIDLTPSCLWKGTGGDQNPKRWEKRETIPNSVHCHHLNGLCIKMGSSESHFNISLIVEDKVTYKICHEPAILSSLFTDKEQIDVSTPGGTTIRSTKEKGEDKKQTKKAR